MAVTMPGRRHWPWARSRWLACATVALVALTLTGAAPGKHGRPHSRPHSHTQNSSPRVLGWGLYSPSALAIAGDDLFVANAGWLTELNATTGTLLRVIDRPSPLTDHPVALAATGNDVFVASSGGGSQRPAVTEIDAATGAAVRVLASPRYGLDGPDALLVQGRTLFVANGEASLNGRAIVGGSVTEINTVTGALERVLSGKRYGFAGPAAMTTVGDQLFVASPEGSGCGAITQVDLPSGAAKLLTDAGCGPTVLAAWRDRLFVGSSAGASVAVLNTASGAQLAQLQDNSYNLSGPPTAMQVAGDTLFIASSTGTVAEVSAPSGKLVRVLAAPQYGFDGPSAFALSSGRLYVANHGGASVTVLAVATGALVRQILGSPYRFELPDALAFVGNDLFVANGGASSVTFTSYMRRVRYSAATCDGCTSQSVTELDSATGRLVAVLAGPRYGLYQPGGEAVSGHDVFVASASGPEGRRGGSVTEIDAKTGSFVRKLAGAEYHFDDPDGLLVYGGHLFVANGGQGYTSGADDITEVATATGALVRVISGPLYQFSWPGAMTVDDGHLYVANSGGICEGCAPSWSVTELDPATGALSRVITGRQIIGPSAIVTAAGHLWVVSEYGKNGSLVELNPSTGAVERVIALPAEGFAHPMAVAASGHDIFLSTGYLGGYGSVAEFSAATGELLRQYVGARYQLEGPGALAVHNGEVWVANEFGGSLTEFPAGASTQPKIG
ncbi:MAG TPA: PQQ-binding-like beta-propeller repeat protein [Acidimicrobiales bacterium]|nr:PQQ-binding-like beta-propeller repeat protein [Acidimicrobiales bacterium]